MKFVFLFEKNLPPSMSRGLPKGFKPENQVWRTVGFRTKGSSGGKAAPGGIHRVRIDKPTGTITAGMFAGVNIDNLHANAKKAKSAGVTTAKDKNGNVIRNDSGRAKLVSKKKDDRSHEIVKKGSSSVSLKNISARDKERLKNSQHSRRDTDKKIRQIDDYLSKNKPLKKGINPERDKKIENLEKQRKALLQARGSSAVAAGYTSGVSTYGRKKGEGAKTRAEYHKEREEYSKGANYSKKEYRRIKNSKDAPKLDKKVR